MVPAFAPVSFTSPFDKILASVGVLMFVIVPPAILILPAASAAFWLGIYL